MSLIVAESLHRYGDNFSNSSMQLSHALDPPGFNPDLTKSRLNDALCLCEMLSGTYPDAASNGGLGGIVVLGVV
ncbi:hypothetical protein V1286_001988 [Bradyrhizobium algeriense]|jgi:hypothetical protein|uniref:Uncharacterized protein n=1 Tax=Bradyrhizobium algeriense TaxID=634784 RepID=A0ABU8B7F0_9BRAD